MPFDSNGNFSLPGGSIVSSGTTIVPSQHNTPLTDIAANGLSQVLPKDGRAAMTGDLPMGGNKITGLGDGTADTDAATVGQAASAIGDFKGSVRDLGEQWLRRDGSLYDVADYPDLAELLPALPDGVQWSNVSVGQTGLRCILATADGGFLIGREYTISSVATSDIYSSENGSLWNVVATIGSGFVVADLAFGGGIYLAADANGKVYTSNDKINWGSSSASIAGGTSPFTTSVAYGAGVFVATTGNSAGRYIHSSTDGVTWTQRYSVGSTNILNKVRFVNGVFIAVGANGQIITSTDGLLWTARTSGTTQVLYGVTFGNGYYVVCGATGTILTSTNLTSWTARTSGTTAQFNEILYSDAGFIAVANAGTARISAANDGTAWASTATGSSLNLVAAAFDSDDTNVYYVLQNGSTSILKGVRTLPTQFQVPDDDPEYGWIKALA